MKISALIVITVLQVSAIHSQYSQDTLNSYHKALRVLNEAVLAIGGKEAVTKVDRISFEMSGVAHARNQSPAPGFPSERRKAEVGVVLEVNNDRAYLEDKVTQPDDSKNCRFNF